MPRSDRRKMIDFIISQLPSGEEVLVLGSGPDGDVTALVTVQGDDIEITSNCPAWVGVREVYDHLRWNAMPAWEQRRWLRPASPPRVAPPAWDGNSGTLTFGGESWKFRLQDGPVVWLLAELHRLNWPRSIRLGHLSSDQVREAARVLRKTRPTIEWGASSDGYLSWRQVTFTSYRIAL